MHLVRRLGALLAASGLAAACAGGPPPPASEEATPLVAPADAASSEVRACTTADAVLDDAALCAPVEGRGGTWRASSSASSWNSARCAFTWASVDGAPPDDAALRALGPGLYALESSCAELAVSAPEVVLEARAGAPDLSHGGMHGCDVCGRLRHDRRGWAVFPVDKAPYKHVTVELDDGTQRWFEVVGARPAGVVSFVLPPPPEGRTWITGTLATL